MGPLRLALAAALLTGCGGADSGSGHPHGTGALWPGEAPEHVREWLRQLPRAARPAERISLLGSGAPPASFDARTAFVGPDGASLIMGALDQGDTENCWVYSPASVVADRLRIAYAAAQISNEFFSTVSYQSWDTAASDFSGPAVSVRNFPDPVQIVECCGRACSGVSPASACSTSGVAIVRPGALYVILDWNRPWEASNAVAIQSDVAAHGPLTTYMQIPAEFHDWFRTVTYPGGPIGAAEVFDTSDTGGNSYASRDTSLAGHFVAILGWGTTADTTPLDYWIVRNSWGQSEVDHGVFLIQRGVNFCMIEQYAQAIPATLPD